MATRRKSIFRQIFDIQIPDPEKSDSTFWKMRSKAGRMRLPNKTRSDFSVACGFTGMETVGNNPEHDYFAIGITNTL